MSLLELIKEYWYVIYGAMVLLTSVVYVAREHLRGRLDVECDGPSGFVLGLIWPLLFLAYLPVGIVLATSYLHSGVRRVTSRITTSNLATYLPNSSRLKELEAACEEMRRKLRDAVTDLSAAREVSASLLSQRDREKSRADNMASSYDTVSGYYDVLKKEHEELQEKHYLLQTDAYRDIVGGSKRGRRKRK